MKRQKKKYESPPVPFDKQRMEKESEILKTFGLRKKKELWITEALLRKYRRLARELAASQNKEKEKILVNKLITMGLLSENAALDDVLGLTIEDFLNRRLANFIYKKGMANSVKQARQFVTHGHVLIGGRKILYPSYLVERNTEDKIQVKTVQQQRKVIANET